ncbi:hypothetical protein VP01_7540g1 [Puccinia sorghi]|uniref:Reverse transcriptase Ty1/copia-type domain-containing protein n=1 Tax=Puccinia sorghi TaxID=27349 RepID=A0A0L6UC45_9BASI|nr:hypothetical protein VP01_7540g1 [Puccinia sorghi]
MQGFKQIDGTDYKETYATTGKVLNTHLASPLINKQESKKDIFIKIPKGVNCLTPYLELKKINGLKQSPKNWYETLKSWLHLIGFYESSCDPYLFICDDMVSMVFFHLDVLKFKGVFE